MTSAPSESGSGPLRLALVGCGGMGRRHVKGLRKLREIRRDDFRLAAVCDPLATNATLAADLAAPALVLVTHHVEEIPPHFTDVLLLREGRIVAQGPIELTLTEANLEATFGMPFELEARGDRYAARAR